MVVVHGDGVSLPFDALVLEYIVNVGDRLKGSAQEAFEAGVLDVIGGVRRAIVVEVILGSDRSSM